MSDYLMQIALLERQMPDPPESNPAEYKRISAEIAKLCDRQRETDRAKRVKWVV